MSSVKRTIQPYSSMRKKRSLDESGKSEPSSRIQDRIINSLQETQDAGGGGSFATCDKNNTSDDKDTSTHRLIHDCMEYICYESIHNPESALEKSEELEVRYVTRRSPPKGSKSQVPLS